MRIEVSRSCHIMAAPAVAYRIIADYRNGHPRILPQQYFGPLTVLEGGTGAGTRIHFTMKVFGKTRELEATIEEPRPGRVLVERILDTGVVTVFTIDPAGAGTLVTIQTTWTRNGFMGRIEGMFASMMLGKIFNAELELLKALAEAGDP